MVVREEPDGIRRYTHIGTGNYNPKTARMYEDLGLMTTDEKIGDNAANLFNNLSGFSRKPSYEDLLVAPGSMRSGLIERIRAEVVHLRGGREAKIRFKANSIVDEAIIDELYHASRAGVPVELLVRGICGLRPGVKGLSETIRVRSVLGRFLEHSRIFAFADGGSPTVYIGSADLMHRNLDRRGEVLVRLAREAAVGQVSDLLDLAFDPSTAAWDLKSDGQWKRPDPNPGGVPLVDLQEALIAAHHR